MHNRSPNDHLPLSSYVNVLSAIIYAELGYVAKWRGSLHLLCGRLFHASRVDYAIDSGLWDSADGRRSTDGYPTKDLRLHNVLGVTLVPMNRQHEAAIYFDQLRNSWNSNVFTPDSYSELNAPKQLRISV